MDALIKFAVFSLFIFGLYVLGLSKLCRTVLLILICECKFILGLLRVLLALLFIVITLHHPLHDLASDCSLILNHLNQLFALKLVTSTFVEPII